MHKTVKFSIKDFFSKCDQIHSFLNGKHHFCEVIYMYVSLLPFSNYPINNECFDDTENRPMIFFLNQEEAT